MELQQASIRPKFDFNTTNGKTYKLIITPTGAITGTINFDFHDGSSYLFQNYDFTTTKEIYFTDNGGVFAAFDGQQTYSIDSFTISVKQVDPNDRWNKGSGWSIVNGKANATNAAFTRLETPSGVNAILTVGNTYKCTFDVVDEDGGEIYVEKNINDAILTNINSVGSYSVIFVAADDQLRFQSRNNSSISIDNVSVKEIKTDTPRIDFTDNTDGHLLLEPQSRNLSYL